MIKTTSLNRVQMVEKQSLFARIEATFEKYEFKWVVIFLTFISIFTFLYFYSNGLGIAYNDARSHLDIGRRVVEGLKSGLAQLGSVWLPLPHLLMIPTIWNDFMWHSGLSGAIVSMISFVLTGALIYKFLEKLAVGIWGRLVGVFVFVANINVLYLQSTAMTELLLLFTMTAGVYELMLWHKNDKVLHLIKSAFYVMLSTLIRYDGWFLFLFAGALIVLQIFRSDYYGSLKRGFLSKLKVAEGAIFMFCTLAAFGIFLWLLWNLLIFKDPLYFAFGPYSAHSQQLQLESAGNLTTKGNLMLSVEHYSYALIYNSNLFVSILGALGMYLLFIDKKIKTGVKIASTALLAPLLFNI